MSNFLELLNKETGDTSTSISTDSNAFSRANPFLRGIAPLNKGSVSSDTSANTANNNRRNMFPGFGRQQFGNFVRPQNRNTNEANTKASENKNNGVRINPFRRVGGNRATTATNAETRKVESNATTTEEKNNGVRINPFRRVNRRNRASSTNTAATNAAVSKVESNVVSNTNTPNRFARTNTFRPQYTQRIPNHEKFVELNEAFEDSLDEIKKIIVEKYKKTHDEEPTEEELNEFQRMRFRSVPYFRRPNRMGMRMAHQLESKTDSKKDTEDVKKSSDDIATESDKLLQKLSALENGARKTSKKIIKEDDVEEEKKTVEEVKADDVKSDEKVEEVNAKESA